MPPRDVVIDACCTLNLLATKREVDIVRALDLRLLETPQTSGQVIYLSTPPDDDGKRGKHAASTEALRKAELLSTHPFDTDALADALVNAAAEIEDKDASCIALAGVLEAPLLCDDRKARRVAKQLFPKLVLLSTLDVLADAALRLGWERTELALVANDLMWGGNFAPPKGDPRSEWYAELIRTSR